MLERELGRRNDPGAGHQKDAVRELVVATQITDQIIERAVDLGRGTSAVEKYLAAATDHEPDCAVTNLAHLPRQRDDRAEAGAPGVHLRLREVQRVFALDAARRHVVADGVTDDLAVAVDRESQLRLRHVPGRVAPDRDLLAGSGNAARRRLKEDFR